MEFTNKLRFLYNEAKLVLLLLACFFLTLITSVRADNLSFILLSGCVAGLLFIELFLGSKSKVTTKVDYFVPAFIGYLFLSMLWANDSSLTIYSSIVWLILILWMILFRNFSCESMNSAASLRRFHLGFIYIFLVALIVVVGKIFVVKFFLGSDLNWYDSFGNNRNVTSVQLVILLPFLLFYKFEKSFYFIFKIVCTGLVLIVAYMASARGAMLSCGLVIFAYLFTLLKQSTLKNSLVSSISLASCVLVLTAIYFFFIKDFDISKFGNDGRRIHLSMYSIELFKQNPINGIGFGNWITEILKNDLNTIPLGDSNYETRMMPRSHNLYTELFAEIGLIGVMFFSIIFFYPIILVKKFIRLPSVVKAAFVAFCTYLLVSNFNPNVNASYLFFSKIQLIAFAALGILYGYVGHIHLLPKLYRPMLIALAFLTFIYFSFYKVKHDSFLKAFNNYELTSVNSINEMEKVYNPIFYNVHKSSYSRYFSVPFMLAKAHQMQGNKQKTEYWYKIALEKFPYNERILSSYLYFKLRNTNDFNELDSLLVNRINEMHSIFFNTNDLNAELALKNFNIDRSKEYLDMPYKGFRYFNDEFVLLKYFNTKYNQLLNDSNRSEMISLNNDILNLENHIYRIDRNAAGKLRSFISDKIAEDFKVFYSRIALDEHISVFEDLFLKAIKNKNRNKLKLSKDLMYDQEIKFNNLNSYELELQVLEYRLHNDIDIQNKGFYENRAKDLNELISEHVDYFHSNIE